MRCVIECIRFLKLYYDIDDCVLLRLEEKITEKGINIYDLLMIVNQAGLKMKAFRSFCIPNQTPVLVLLRPLQQAHMMVLIQRSLFFVTLYDGVDQVIKRNVLRFYFCYSKVYILCYNERKIREELYGSKFSKSNQFHIRGKK